MQVKVIHETRITDFTAARSLLSCALWCGMGRLWSGMGGRRLLRRQHGPCGRSVRRGWARGRHQNPSPDLRVLRKVTASLPTISHDFPRFPGISQYFPTPPHPPVKGPRAVRIGNTTGWVFTTHETRITDFTAARSLLSCAFWCGMGRLWCGMGGRRPPCRQHGLLGFHQPRDTQHGFSLSLQRLQGEQPQTRPTGFHESRVTKHESRLL